MYSPPKKNPWMNIVPEVLQINIGRWNGDYEKQKYIYIK